MARLLAHNINLFVYHLPLDALAMLGNNAQLALRLDWTPTGRFCEQEIRFVGVPPAPTSAGELAQHIESVLSRALLLTGDPARKVARLVWCSGGARGYFEVALETGADVFVSGEVSVQTVHAPAKPAWLTSPPVPTPPSAME